MKSRFLYFHGFKSSVEASITFKRIRGRFPNTEGRTFNYEIENPFVKIKENQILKYEVLIGNSFGGMFAAYYGLKYQIPFMLINPAITPSYTLNIFDYVEYEKEVQEMIKEELVRRTIPKVLILAKNDEVVDRNIILSTGLQTVSIFAEPDWGHMVPEDEIEFNDFIIEPLTFLADSIFI